MSDRGGLTNKLYCCETHKADVSPSKVLLRVYCGKMRAIMLLRGAHRPTAESTDMLPRYLDVAVICILQHMGLGVSVYGLFDSGRFEGWIDGHALEVRPLPYGDHR